MLLTFSKNQTWLYWKDFANHFANRLEIVLLKDVTSLFYFLLTKKE